MGGAIFNFQGTVAIATSTLVSNLALGGATPGATVDVSPADGIGGVLFNLNGAVSMESSTVVGNTARNGAGAPDNAGAVYNLGFDAATARHATLSLHRTIMSLDGASSDLASSAPPKVLTNLPLTNLSSSAVDASDRDLVTALTHLPGGTISGAPLASAPRLAPLGLYRGGLTPAMPPLAGSPGIDVGGSGCPSGDQLGQHRPHGPACDLGSVEYYAPANDNFGRATVLLRSNQTVFGDNIGATLESGELVLLPGASGSVWSEWIAPASGTARVDTCASTFDTVLGVFTGGRFSKLKTIATNNDSSLCGAASKDSAVTFFAKKGTTYRILVEGVGGAEGRIVLHVHGKQDKAAPGVVIDSGPKGPTGNRRPKFRFHSPDPGSTFRCSLDHGKPKFVPCNSGTFKPAHKLARNGWTFRVKATDPDGNTDKKAKTRKFQVT
jgi:hypothetical protein